MAYAHLVQPDPGRTPIVVYPRNGGGWTLTAGTLRLHLTADETHQLVGIVSGSGQ